ncbi:MAG TPA: hypothetical protein VM282_03075 [Acidimicrobiales bacterium]|nr:hypothetical protein [Acidimicrobiales bacterium]
MEVDQVVVTDRGHRDVEVLFDLQRLPPALYSCAGAQQQRDHAANGVLPRSTAAVNFLVSVGMRRLLTSP